MPDLTQCPYCLSALTPGTLVCAACHRVAARPSFPAVRLRAGYSTTDVDAFVERMSGVQVDASPGWLINEVTQVRFRPVMLKTGYDMPAVDRWLDSVVDAAKAYEV